MRKCIAGILLGFGLSYAAYKVLTHNTANPESVPEALAREAREKGWL